MSVVSMKSLLESGVHFGHQTRRWDPRMSKYIFAERNGIHIIDLQKTMVEIKTAYDAIKNAVLANKQVLFVGTKKQARAAVKREAERCGQFFVNNRWLGGMLTNYSTIKKSIFRLKKIEKMEVDGTFDSLVKKEKLKLLKEKDKLEQNLGGIKNMNSLPGIIFIVDSKKEAIAVSEAKKLGIPIVAIVDTNCNPNEIDFPIPGNDDAIRAIDLFCSIISNASIEASNEMGANIMNEVDEEAPESTVEKNEAPAGSNEKPVVEKTKEPVKEQKAAKEETKTKAKEDKKEDAKVSVSMVDVKKLRDVTNAGMMDCKNALVNSNGDFDAALKLLKEKGLADAKKRSDRATKEGGVFIKQNGNRLAVALIGCETDFVSSNDIFKQTKEEILDKMLETGDDKIESYNDKIQDAIAQIKENIEFKQAKVLDITDSQYAATYIHGNNKIGVVSVYELKDAALKDNENFKEFTNNVCLHIAANSPYYLDQSAVPASEIDEQKDIIKKQMADSNKPADVMEKIIDGRISKHLSEICLLNQKYVKDDKLSIEKYVADTAKELGSEIKIVDFIRFMIG